MYEAKIVDEIWKALNHLPKKPRPLSYIVAQALYDEAAACGGMSDLLGAIGSWGDGQTDEDTLYYLQQFNKES